MRRIRISNAIMGRMKQTSSMHKVPANCLMGFLAVMALGGFPLSPARGHEKHQMQCNQTTIDAIRADLQMMKDGAAKRTAVKEADMAESKMAGKDKEGCIAHLHNAMEMIEE